MTKIDAAALQSDPRVLWCHSPRDLVRENAGINLRTPGALFSADPDAVLSWLAAHPEYRRLPLFFWGYRFPEEAARNLGGAVWRFHEADTREGFCEVVGPGAIMAARGSMIATTSQPDAVVASAESIARTMYRVGALKAGQTVWEIGASRSGGGLLAIGAAVAAMGPAVAVDDGAPGGFGPMVATAWGARLRVVLGSGRLAP